MYCLFNTQIIKMRKVLQNCILLFLLLAGNQLYSQDVRISGTVIGNDGPIPGVSVTLKNGNSGVATDANGVFNITAPQNGNSARPDGGLNIQIRGASINARNAPLVVVDGFPIADVEQIENGGRYESGSQSATSS